MSPSPLTGVRVVDLTQLLPGPFCTMILADYGAEVIKVERPPLGDPGRYTAPVLNGFSARFAFVNRNKRSVALDLKQPLGRASFLNLVRSADVLVEGFRPGVTERLGIDYASLSAIQPRLVYCSISGYGQTGPHRLKAGHDLNYLAMAGTIDLTGTRDAPGLPGTQIADLAGGSLQAVIGILLALQGRGRSGVGQYVDISMMDGSFYLQVEGLAHLFGGTEPVRGATRLTGRFPCYQLYETRDGRYMALGALEEKFWHNFCKAIDRPDLVPRQFAEGEEGEAVVAEVRRVFATRTQAEWAPVFERFDACCTPVRNAAEAVADPHMAERELVIEHRHPIAGPLRQVGFPIRLSATPGQIRLPAPELGADTSAVLTDLGYSAEQVAGVLAENEAPQGGGDER